MKHEGHKSRSSYLVLVVILFGIFTGTAQQLQVYASKNSDKDNDNEKDVGVCVVGVKSPCNSKEFDGSGSSSSSSSSSKSKNDDNAKTIKIGDFPFPLSDKDIAKLKAFCERVATNGPSSFNQTQADIVLNNKSLSPTDWFNRLGDNAASDICSQLKENG